MSRRGFAAAALAALTAMTQGSAAPRPEPGTGTAGGSGRGGAATGEMRGMWVATVTNRDWPSRPGLSAGFYSAPNCSPTSTPPSAPASTP